MEPPVITVDANLTSKGAGICHVVWKAHEPNTVAGPSGKNLPKETANVQGIGWKKNDLMLHYSNSVKATGFVTPLPLRINIPGDIQGGTYLPVPRIATDDDDRVHVVWLGRDPWDAKAGYQIRYSRIKWDGHGTGLAGKQYAYGTVENRSVVVSGPHAEVERANPDLAIGDGVLHVVWSDGRDNEGETVTGCRVYRAAITLKTGAVQPGSEVPISELLDTDAISPRIALRPEKDFLEWTGYEDAEDTNFHKTEPDAVVNLRDEAINVTATFKPWPGPRPCPPDPTISLPAGAQGSSLEVPISADDGFGAFSIVWQEETPSVYEIALHRPKYWVGIYGLWTPYKRVSRAWHEEDRTAAAAPANMTSGTVVDEPIRVTDTYRELIRYSNYHEAQGMIADGVTPLIIRFALPAGEYHVFLSGDEDSDNLASRMKSRKLQVYNHGLEAFEPCPASGPQIKVPIGPDGVNALEAILYIKGFDHTDPDMLWPVSKDATASIQVKLWKKKTNGESLIMTEGGDPPFAIVPFSVAKPPVVLIHGFNGTSETWSKDFKKVIGDRIGPDMIKVPAYGQEKVPVGILADFLTTFKESHPSLYTDLEVLNNQYNSTTEWLKGVESKLTDIGVLPEEEDSGTDVLGTFLSAVKAATYWQKSASAHAPLKTLEKMLALKLYVVEEKLRREDRWAFTRYDVIGHCQGGVLLRMLSSNEDMGRSTTFLHERNCHRGRFRRIVTIGSPHRGSRLTSYWRLYKDVAWEQAENLAANDPDALLDPLPALGAAASLVGAALPYYAERNGYMEPKFDTFVGEIVEINQDLPVHPKAKFHLISTIVNHDSLGVWPIFHQLGLKKGSANGLFEFTLPPPPTGTEPRYSDGLVDWRSHFGGIDFVNGTNDNMLTHLDEWRGTGDYLVRRAGAEPIDDKAWASHVPPFPVTAIIGEPPGPMTLDDLWELAKKVGTGDWKGLLLQAATGLIQKVVKDSGVTVPVFGTYVCQTNSHIAGLRIRDLLDEEIGMGSSKTFGPFYNYEAGSATGDGNPEGDDFLSAQESALKQAIHDAIRFLPNPRENGILAPASRRGDAVTAHTLIYELNPPAAFPIKAGTSPEWHVTVVNGIQCSDLGVTLVPDATDPLIVHITIDPDVYGQVFLHCTYTGADDKTVIISPLLIGTYNMGDVVAIYFAYFSPVLTKEESLQMALEAEYSDGTIGPLYPTTDDPITWGTSDASILTVDTGGKIVSVGPTGVATITTTRGDLSASVTITVAGHGPDVRLTLPTGLEDLTGGDDLDLEAIATDVDGTVASVTFFANATLIGGGEDTTAPYEATWTNVPAGDYEVYAVAVDDDGILTTSESRFIQVANRPPTMDSWATPTADQWYAGTVYLSAEASDPDGDEVTVQFEYSLDSTDGANGSWAQCYYPLTHSPYDCQWQSFPLEDVDAEVWLRVTATDVLGESSPTLTRRVKIDNSAPGLTFDPHPGDTDIALTVQPTITFDNPVTHPGGGVITNGDLGALIQFSSAMSPVASTVTINAGKTVITVAPDVALDGVTRYTFALVGDVRDSVADAVLPRASCTFSTTYGAAAALAFVDGTPGGEAGSLLDAPLRVAVVDAQGNTVLSSVASVTVALKAAARSLPTLSGTTTVNAVDGVAEFSDLSMDVTGNYTFEASAGGLDSADSAEFTIRPSALARLTVSFSQGTVVAGTAVDVTVAAHDQFDNLKNDFIGTPNFSTSDSRALLPRPYTFYETDAGSHTYRLAFTPGTRGEQWVKARSGGIESAQATITVTNASPDTATPDSPTNGAYCGLSPTLRLLPFGDPDETAHDGTHWQVATDQGFSAIIWDSGEGSAATTLVMPSGVLAENTSYWWRARFKDDSGDAGTEWGGWSIPAAFHTAYAFPFTDDFSADRGWQGLAGQGWSI
ncbi:MAG: hypothetical protein KAI66_07605, partial [Lentisphaeria bacterium]|nr:hypothetical protein [Lentisphaeria bacterium]